MTSDTDKRTEDASFAYTKEWEGFSSDAKPDPVGIPTYGHGYALIFRDGGEFSIRKGTDIVIDLAAVGVTITDEHVSALEDIAKDLKTAHALKNRGKKEEAEAHFAAAKKRRLDAKFPTITRDQAEQLFRNVVQESIEIVRKHIGTTVYDKLDVERRAALIDQAYRRPGAFKRAAKGIGEALAKDDFEGAKQAFLEMGRGTRSRTNADYLRNPHAADRIRVRDGDNLEAIAGKLSAERGTKVTVQELMKLNGITDPRTIFGGQLLRLPETVGSDVGAPGSLPADARERDDSSPPAPKRKPEPPSRLPPDPKRKPERARSSDKRTEREAEPASDSPEREQLRAAMRQPVDRVEHTLLKPASEITRPEIDEVMAHDGYWPRDGDPRAEAFQDKTRDFFETFFERGSTKTPPETERPLAVRGGGDLGPARQRIAEALAPAAERDGLAPTIKDLQENLNELRFAGAHRVLPDLAVDGDLGPRTLARIDEELARLGAGPLAESVRQGRRA